MKKQISPKIVSLIFSVLVICFAVAFYTLAVWQEPTQSQPKGNVPAPLNTSSEAQAKIGGLLLNTGGYPNGLIVDDGGNPTKGFVGIGTGTAGPSQKLDVSGQIHATGDICTDAGGGVCLSTGGGLSCTLKSASTNPAGGDPVLCDAGKIRTGGGCQPSAGGNTTATAPASNNGWGCSGSGVSMTTYVVCCEGGGGGGAGGGGAGGQSVQVVGNTNASTNSASWVDMPGMSNTITTTGGNVLVMFSATMRTQEDWGGYTRLLIDGIEKHRIGWELGNNAALHSTAMQWLETGLNAGSHTFKIQWYSMGVTIYQDGVTYPRVLTELEL